MVTPSGGEPLWAPDQHPMCLCGSTPHIHQVTPLAASPHAQFHSSGTLTTLLHHTALFFFSPYRTLLHFSDFLLEVVTPAGGEPLWAPDQHPMCVCGSTPRFHQVMQLAASPHARFHSQSPPHCTILPYLTAPYCTLLHL